MFLAIQIYCCVVLLPLPKAVVILKQDQGFQPLAPRKTFQLKYITPFSPIKTAKVLVVPAKANTALYRATKVTETSFLKQLPGHTQELPTLLSQVWMLN